MKPKRVAVSDRRRGAALALVGLMSVGCCPRTSALVAAPAANRAPSAKTTIAAAPATDEHGSQSEEDLDVKVSFDFEALTYMTGPVFTAKRDQWLRGTPDAAEQLTRYVQTRGWRVHATAVILRSWLDARPACEGLLAALRARDVETFPPNHVVSQTELFEGSHRDDIAARPEWSACAQGLAYEALTKRDGEWSFEWRHLLLRFLPKTEVAADALFFVLDHASGKDERDLVADIILAFPKSMTRRRRRAANARQDELRAAIEDELGYEVP